MKTINILALFAISIIASCWAVGCDKDEPTLPIKKSEHRTPPDLDKTSTLAWETVYCIGLLDHELFIGSKYLGIQNWPCISSPPPIYPAAVFPENSFGSTFDIEMAGLKNPIFVQTDFSIPFFSTIENPSAVNYIRFLKHMFQSEEYKSYSGPKLNLYRFTNLKNLDNLIKIFPENPCFAETLKSIVKQKMALDKIKSWTIGEIRFTGFTVSMDVPEKGIFTNELQPENGLVYVRSLTYGSTAYFVIGSDLPYSEVRTKINLPSLIEIEKLNLKNTDIILLTNSSIDQEADIYTTFDALYDYLRHPYTEGTYGYPIYCKGCFLIDNSYFQN